MQACGYSDVLAYQGAAVQGDPTELTLGNEAGVRTTQRTIADVAGYDGPCDIAVVDAAVAGSLRNDALLPLSLRAVRAGTAVVVSGASDAPAWADLPLRALRDGDAGGVVLTVPPHFEVPWLDSGSVVRAEATVERGFGRGSRQLGVPTANLSPAELEAQGALPDALRAKGVYFGYAQVASLDSAVVPCVLNVGTCPPFAREDGKSDVTVEVHLLHDYGEGSEFYGAKCRVMVKGYLRPEMPFAGVDQLLARINADIGLARSTLGARGDREAVEADAFWSS